MFVPFCVIFTAGLTSSLPGPRSNQNFRHRLMVFQREALEFVAAIKIVRQEVRLFFFFFWKSLLRFLVMKVHPTLTVLPKGHCNVFHQTC